MHVHFSTGDSRSNTDQLLSDFAFIASHLYMSWALLESGRKSLCSARLSVRWSLEVRAAS
jgi:hypothetical protein